MNKPVVLVLHGPNLNLLGERETGVYGTVRLEEINASLSDLADKAGIELDVLQSNHEGVLVDKIQAARNSARYIIINPAAFHRSQAIRDALLAVDIPFIEVHLSNIFSREAFRRGSLLADIAVGMIAGFGLDAYLWALEYAMKEL